MGMSVQRHVDWGIVYVVRDAVRRALLERDEFTDEVGGSLCGDCDMYSTTVLHGPLRDRLSADW